MDNGGIFLITKTIRRGSCPRFSPPPLQARTIYDRNSEVAVMIGPRKKEVQVSVVEDGETRRLMEKIMEKSASDPKIEVKEITSSDASDLLKEIVAIFQRIPEEPSSEAALWGLIRERFDLIVSPRLS